MCATGHGTGSNQMRSKPAILAALSAVLVLTIAGCGAGSEPPAPSATADASGADAGATAIQRGEAAADVTAVERGQPPAYPVQVSPGQRLNSPEYAVQAFLWWRPELAERDMLMVKDMGFRWIKQGFGWRDIELEKGKFDWEKTDHIVQKIVEYQGLRLIARVDHQPEWARDGCSMQGPPSDLQDYADFLTAVATRYKGQIAAYQIWNEPNLAREWCDQAPSPAAYAEMLQVAYQAVKAADPNALVISSGLSPTGTAPPEAMPDDTYLDALYQAMGGSSAGYFDLLGVHAPGYAAPPETSPEEAAANPAYGGERFFTFRRVEDLRRHPGEVPGRRQAGGRAGDGLDQRPGQSRLRLARRHRAAEGGLPGAGLRLRPGELGALDQHHVHHLHRRPGLDPTGRAVLVVHHQPGRHAPAGLRGLEGHDQGRVGAADSSAQGRLP